MTHKNVSKRSNFVCTGIPAKKPDFMVKNRKEIIPDPSDSESDDDWMPAKDKAKTNAAKGEPKKTFGEYD